MTKKQTVMRKRPRRAFAAAAVLMSASMIAPSYAVGGSFTEKAFPIIDQETLYLNAKTRCESFNIASKTGQISALTAATVLDFAFGFSGLANGALEIYKNLVPDSALNGKQMDCPTAARKAVDLAGEALQQRNMIAERGRLLTSVPDAMLGGLKIVGHKRLVDIFDNGVFCLYGDHRQEAVVKMYAESMREVIENDSWVAENVYKLKPKR